MGRGIMPMRNPIHVHQPRGQKLPALLSEDGAVGGWPVSLRSTSIPCSRVCSATNSLSGWPIPPYTLYPLRLFARTRDFVFAAHGALPEVKGEEALQSCSPMCIEIIQHKFCVLRAHVGGQ